jgi:transposase-like protein
MSIDMTNPIFNDEAKALEHLEQIRWPDGPFCPHCGEAEKVYRLHGKAHRDGLIHCNSCEGSFTVRTGTVLESSHVPLHKWVLAYRLMNSSKKGFSAHQLHRTLGVTYKTAWFMAHRIRESMRQDELAPMGGSGVVVEIDETAIGRTVDAPKKGRALGGRSGFRNTVLTLVKRGGEARSFHIDTASVASMLPIIQANVAKETAIMTDEWAAYREIGKGFASHDTVSHKEEEYVRYERKKVVTTNTVEGYYSIFKRGMKGVYQHCGEQHLHRYLAEFDFRYSNRVALGVDDSERTIRAIKGGHGKRLTYKPASSTQSPRASNL